MEPGRQHRAPFFDAANVLTLLRIPLAALLWLRPESLGFILAVLAGAALTDVLDGRLARRNPRHSRETGAWLDPLCDKVFVLSALFLVASIRDVGIGVPFLIATREILEGPMLLIYPVLRARRHQPSTLDMTAAPIGKATTFLQFLALAAMLLRPSLALPMAIAASAVGACAAGFYFWRCYQMNHAPVATVTRLETREERKKRAG